MPWLAWPASKEFLALWRCAVLRSWVMAAVTHECEKPFIWKSDRESNSASAATTGLWTDLDFTNFNSWAEAQLKLECSMDVFAVLRKQNFESPFVRARSGFVQLSYFYISLFRSHFEFLNQRRMVLGWFDDSRRAASGLLWEGIFKDAKKIIGLLSWAQS